MFTVDVVINYLLSFLASTRIKRLCDHGLWNSSHTEWYGFVFRLNFWKFNGMWNSKPIEPKKRHVRLYWTSWNTIHCITELCHHSTQCVFSFIVTLRTIAKSSSLHLYSFNQTVLLRLVCVGLGVHFTPPRFTGTLFIRLICWHSSSALSTDCPNLRGLLA